MNKIILISVFLLLSLLVGCGQKDYSEEPSQTQMVCSELCEYRNGDLYYKAPCSTIIDLINLKKTWENFDSYISSERNKFKTDCKSFIENNVYSNVKNREGYENITLEDVKEDIQFFINMSCKVN